MITDLQMEYIRMGYSIEEARELAPYEVAAVQKIRKEIDAEKTSKPKFVEVARSRHARKPSKNSAISISVKPKKPRSYVYNEQIRHSIALACAANSKQCVDHTGKVFASQAERARAWGLPPDVVNYRVKVLQWSVERALTTPLRKIAKADRGESEYAKYIPEFIKKTHVLDPLGIKYRSFAMLCNAWHIEPRTVVKRLKRGWGFYKALAFGNQYVKYVR